MPGATLWNWLLQHSWAMSLVALIVWSAELLVLLLLATVALTVWKHVKATTEKNARRRDSAKTDGA